MAADHKRFLKQLAVVLANCVTVPCWFAYSITTTAFGAGWGFSAWSQFFSLFPGTIGSYLRAAFYRRVLAAVAEDSVVSFGVLFSNAATCLGKSCYIGPYCVIGETDIGNDVLIGSQVSIMNGSRQHGIARLDIPVREQPGEWPRITIGEDTWIGDKAIVMADVGKHCVVGAGAVVTKPVEDYKIVVGNPARVIGDRRELGEEVRGARDEARGTSGGLRVESGEA